MISWTYRSYAIPECLWVEKGGRHGKVENKRMGVVSEEKGDGDPQSSESQGTARVTGGRDTSERQGGWTVDRGYMKILVNGSPYYPA